MIPINCNGTKRTCMLKDVLHVPEMGFSLVSVNQLTNNGQKVTFAGSRVEITNAKIIIATGSKGRGLYSLDRQKKS